MGGPGMVTTARATSPQYLHYHRAGHGAVTSEREARVHRYVLAKMARLQGASGIHVGPWLRQDGGWEGRPCDRLHTSSARSTQGPAYFQKWYGMRPHDPIISGA